jgi:sensor histidine kinase YesM
LSERRGGEVRQPHGGQAIRHGERDIGVLRLARCCLHDMLGIMRTHGLTAAGDRHGARQSSVLDQERDRAERKVNLVRGLVLVVLGIAAAAYAPVLPRRLNAVNGVVLIPMLLWTIAQASLYYQRASLPSWLSVVNPVLDVLAVTITMAGYGLEANPTLALKSPMVLAYFAILAARPMLSSARRAAVISAFIVIAYASLDFIFLVLQGVTIGDPVSASGSASVALLDEAAKLTLLAAAGAIATYATWWHEQLARRYAVQAEEQALLQMRLASSRLDSLRQQLRPHFLFNALNAITALVDADPPTAQRMISGLGELMRVSLDTGGAAEVPLRDELRILDHYTAIQRIRFEDRLVFITDVDAAVGDSLVPSLILQPLVENSIQYGLARCENRTCIQVRAWRERDSLALDVIDDGPGLSGQPLGTISERVGIGNARARLRYLYGENHAFEIESPATGGFKVSMRIPYHITAMEEVPA